MKKGKGREKNKEKTKGQKRVLIGVLKNRRDLRILLLERWYRIPVAFLPKRKFTHVAFYQPTVLGPKGKQIEYYARVVGKEIKKRVELLPQEGGHPQANEDYLKISFKSIEKLEKPIRNVIPRRVSFGFTGLKTLRSARDILELYGVPRTEQILERRLSRVGIDTFPQRTISAGGKRYRLDIAIFCERGNIAIECDNRKAHSSKVQKLRDRQKDTNLKKHGWQVLRFTEPDILERLEQSVARVQEIVYLYGGQNNSEKFQMEK